MSRISELETELDKIRSDLEDLKQKQKSLTKTVIFLHSEQFVKRLESIVKGIFEGAEQEFEQDQSD